MTSQEKADKAISTALQALLSALSHSYKAEYGSQVVGPLSDALSMVSHVLDTVRGEK